MLSQREYVRLKGRLTRRLNTARRLDSVAGWRGVLDEVEYAERIFGDQGWPDNWPRWSNQARWDAEGAIKQCQLRARNDAELLRHYDIDCK